MFQSTAWAPEKAWIYAVDVRANPPHNHWVRNLKGQPDESEHNWQTWRARGNPRKIRCSDHLFICLHYRKISPSVDLRLDEGLSSIWYKGCNGVRTFNIGRSLKVKNNLYYQDPVTPPGQWQWQIDLVCLIWVFWRWNRDRGKYSTTTATS